MQPAQLVAQVRSTAGLDEAVRRRKPFLLPHDLLCYLTSSLMRDSSAQHREDGCERIPNFIRAFIGSLFECEES